MENNTTAPRLEAMKDELFAHAKMIWERPETAGYEAFSSDAFRQKLIKNGFAIHETPGVPYAFYGEYGVGSPVIAILGEYDALPGLSQKAGAISREPLADGEPGHGCGHNLLGTASLGAALALKEYLAGSGASGTVRFYGCPAEEALSGKVEMIRAGAFEGCDVALSWHPMALNAAYNGGFLANNSIKFRFHGISSHAAAAPEAGRSALDAVELMNVGANYLREHIIDFARIHYTITKAGAVPNIIPPEAESWYYVRAPRRRDVNEITERLVKVAKGAAMMTETSVDYEIICGCYEALANDVMYNLTLEVMNDTELPSYTDEDLAYARALQATLPPGTLEKETDRIGEGGDLPVYSRVMDKETTGRIAMTGSSDSGDVSWLMPMNLFITSAWPIGTPPHSWQATSASGSTIGFKSMLYAAKVLAGMGRRLLDDPSLVARAKEEFANRTKDQKYVCPLNG